MRSKVSDDWGLAFGGRARDDGGMNKETIQEILKERSIKGKGGVYSIPKESAPTLLHGKGRGQAHGPVVSLKLRERFLAAETRRGAVLYVEYEHVYGMSFEGEDPTEHRTGF